MRNEKQEKRWEDRIEELKKTTEELEKEWSKKLSDSRGKAMNKFV
ncbi:10649_t:CDS:1, partial [Funneliformis caledonium]